MEILLDLTHGVNYLPATLLHTVLNYLAPILAVRCGSEVLVKAYNAVPVSQSAFEFHKVFSRVVDRVEPMGGPGDRVIKAFSAAMPLLLAKLCHNHTSQPPRIEGSITHPTASSQGQVTYRARPGKPGEAASALAATEICEKVNRHVKTLCGEPALPLDAVSELFSFAQRFAGDLARITAHEIYAVHDTVGRAVLLEGRCAGLCELYGSCSEELLREAERGEPSERTMRNFLAHGGMLRDLVKACSENGEKLLSYVSARDDQRLAKLLDEMIRRL